MAINYSLAKLNAKFGEKSDGKFYARAQVNSTTNLKEFSQLIASQTTVSRADVSAVLISSVENLIMELKRGNQVEFGELGKFRVQLMSEGTEKASDFTANKITGIRIQFVPGEDLDDLFSKLEFTPVASRLVQKAALKAEKAGATIIDINEAKTNAKKDNAGSDSDDSDKKEEDKTPTGDKDSESKDNPSSGSEDKDNPSSGTEGDNQGSQTDGPTEL